MKKVGKKEIRKQCYDQAAYFLEQTELDVVFGTFERTVCESHGEDKGAELLEELRKEVAASIRRIGRV